MSNFQSLLKESKQQYEANAEKLVITDKHSGYYLSLRRDNFEDEKEEKRFIKNVERLVRSSLEYREWLAFIKDTLNLNYCVFTKETDAETDDIEIHHHPLTLYDIVMIVVDTYITNDKQFCTFDIASEVINLHFQLKVGFVPLLGSLHKKFHNGFLDIPIELVYGDYKYLLENYFVRESLQMKVSRYESFHLSNVELPQWQKDNYIMTNKE